MPLVMPAYESIRLSIDNGTSEDYHLVRLYYSWYAGWFYRHRLQMIANLIGDAHFNRVLEVGTGSGIFIKELLKHTDAVAGIDIHPTYDGVAMMLAREQIDVNRVELRQGDIFDIPYENESFDAVVCISVLEHFADPLPALQELRRVTRPGGTLLLGFPARNSITDTLFQMLGYQSKEIHPAGHKTILHAIQSTLSIDALNYYPFSGFSFYVACRALKRDSPVPISR